MTGKIFLQSVPRETSTGIHKWTGRDGKPMNKTKNGRYTADGITALYDVNTGQLKTGLLDQVENPWFGEDKSKLGKNWDYLAEKTTITRQELLEKKHGREPGFYTARPPRKGDKPSDITYMQNFCFKLKEGLTSLDLTKAEHEIAYYVCLASKYVANSKKDWLDHKYPSATHYISHHQEDEELLLKSRKRKAEAFARLESEDLTDENRMLVVKALHWQKGLFDSRQAYNTIYGKIESADLSSPGNDAERFLKVSGLLKDAAGREELNARALLHDLVDLRIVSNIQGTYKWLAKDMVIGNRESEAVDFLLNPNKQPETDSMRKEIAAKLLS